MIGGTYPISVQKLHPGCTPTELDPGSKCSLIPQPEELPWRRGDIVGKTSVSCADIGVGTGDVWRGL